MNTQESTFASLFRTYSHGDKSIMAVMLDKLLQGNTHQECRKVIQAGYMLAIK